MPAPPRLALVLTFDRLPLKLLSCYGSELGQTPVLDRLASKGVLGDLHFADDLAEERTRHAWWDGGTASNSASEQPVKTLAEIATDSGIACRLISDCQPFSWDVAPQGWQTTYLEHDTEQELTVTDALERLRAEAARQLQELREAQQPGIVWVHSGELPAVPIPAMEFLELFLDELPRTIQKADETEEPERRPAEESEESGGDSEEEGTIDVLSEDDRAAAFELIEETLSLLSGDSTQLEPAHIKTWNVLAAARLAECDRGIGRFYELIEPQVLSGEGLFLLTADRGMALGEAALTKRLEATHLQGPLQEETMHVPLLLMNGPRDLGRRIGALTTHADLPATLLDWSGIEYEFPSGRSLLPLATGKAGKTHEQLICTAGDWQAIREREWLLVRNRSEGVEKLYIKPEDRWQVLDVLSQYIDEADRLLDLLDRT
jgi:hypothetical protein